MTGCICGCGDRLNARHHVVYAQHCRARGADVTDERNLVPVARDCHAAHHNRQRPYLLAVLPNSVFEFAEEVFGALKAYEYLRRYYAGEDPRLTALVEDSCEVCDTSWPVDPRGGQSCPSCESGNVVRMAGEL